MLPDLERLILLQDIERRASAAARIVADAPGTLAALATTLANARAGVDAAKTAIADNQVARRALERDLQSAQQRLEKYKDQTMAVKTNEEFHAMQHQIKAVEAEIGVREEKVLVNMMEADEINATIKKAEAALKAAQAKLASERGIIEAEVTANQGIVAECNTARAAIIASLDNKGVVDTFQRIAKVRGTAIARAEGERCTVCQVRLRPVVFAEVRKSDSIVQCESCNRILFYVPPKPADPPATPAS